jgi:hypothetical protein
MMRKHWAGTQVPPHAYMQTLQVCNGLHIGDAETDECVAADFNG